jgi:hypothetical protein
MPTQPDGQVIPQYLAHAPQSAPFGRQGMTGPKWGPNRSNRRKLRLAWRLLWDGYQPLQAKCAA